MSSVLHNRRATPHSNHGTIVGKHGTNHKGGAGHAGLTLPASYLGNFLNDGLIIGGAGGSGAPGSLGGLGGAGVSMAGGTLTNMGTIIGGAGGAGGVSKKSGLDGGAGGMGGAGVDLTGGTLVTTGLITGGAGGAGGAAPTQQGHGGAGGAGVYLNGGILIASGTITGGAGGLGYGGAGASGAAVLFGSMAGTLVLEAGAVFNGLVVANAATQDMLVLGANGGTLSGLGSAFTGFADIAEQSGADWMLAGTNTITTAETLSVGGTLTVGAATDIAGSVSVSGTLALDPGAIISGAVTGSSTGSAALVLGAGTGAGTLPQFGETGYGGIGAYLQDSAGSNSGTITGGFGKSGGYYASGGIGGAGVVLNGGTLANSRAVTGGAGGGSALYGSGGAGGAGLWVSQGALTNDGTITGGNGGQGGYGIYSLGHYMPGGPGGAGGTGVIIDNGTRVNYGNIARGAGGGASLGALPGARGIGVYLNGGTLVEFGIVAGSATGLSGGTAGAAVAFGNNASTLVLEAGAVLNGLVQADSAAQDTLMLGGGGTGTGTLTGLGTEFTGFQFVNEQAGATWMLKGKNALSQGETFTSAGTLLVVAGTLTGAGGAVFENTGSLIVDGLGTTTISLALDNSGFVSVQSGTLAFLGGISNDGIVDVGGSVISFNLDLAGTGQLQLAAAGTLSLLNGSSSFQDVNFLAQTGVLDLANPLSFLGTIAGFQGQDSIDLQKTGETSFSFNNNVLTVDNGTQVVAALAFGPGYSASDFTIHSDSHGGSLIKFV